MWGIKVMGSFFLPAGTSGMDRILFLSFPKASGRITNPLLTQHQDESATRLYSPMKKDRRVEWSQTSSPWALKELDPKPVTNDSLPGWWIVSEPKLLWRLQQQFLLLSGWLTASSDTETYWLSIPPLLNEIFLCADGTEALMLIFESVRSQMPSGCGNKWEVPTDCKGKWGCLLFCIWTIISFQEGKGRIWGEKKVLFFRWCSGAGHGALLLSALGVKSCILLGPGPASNLLGEPQKSTDPAVFCLWETTFIPVKKRKFQNHIPDVPKNKFYLFKIRAEIFPGLEQIAAL